MVKGVILCGGEGTRLRPLTHYLQKTMIPIGSTEKPLLEYIVKLMAYHGVKQVAMLVCYKAEQIMNYFGDGSRFDVEITYVRDRPDKCGSGWALLNAYEQGALTHEEALLVYYGDILSDIDLAGMYRSHVKGEADATLALASEYQVPVGVAEVEYGWVRKLTEKPTIPLLISVGVTMVEGGLLEDLRKLGRSGDRLDIMGDFIPYLIRKRRRIQAYLHNSFWYDLASIERYEKLDPKILEDHLDKLLFNNLSIENDKATVVVPTLRLKPPKMPTSRRA